MSDDDLTVTYYLFGDRVSLFGLEAVRVLAALNTNTCDDCSAFLNRLIGEINRRILDHGPKVGITLRWLVHYLLTNAASAPACVQVSAVDLAAQLLNAACRCQDE